MMRRIVLVFACGLCALVSISPPAEAAPDWKIQGPLDMLDSHAVSDEGRVRFDWQYRMEARVDLGTAATHLLELIDRTANAPPPISDLPKALRTWILAGNLIEWKQPELKLGYLEEGGSTTVTDTGVGPRQRCETFTRMAGSLKPTICTLKVDVDQANFDEPTDPFPGRYNLSARHSIGHHQIVGDFHASGQLSIKLLDFGGQITVEVPVRVSHWLPSDYQYPKRMKADIEAKCPKQRIWDPDSKTCVCVPGSGRKSCEIVSIGDPGLGTGPDCSAALLDPACWTCELHIERVVDEINFPYIWERHFLVCVSRGQVGRKHDGSECVGSSCPGDLAFGPAAKRACFDGDIWRPCDDHPSQLAPAFPSGSFEHLFPACFTSPLGTLTTPCHGSGSGPDLTVASARALEPNPIAGDSLELELTLLNQGNVSAPNSRYTVRFTPPTGGIEEMSGQAGSLSPGASRRSTVDLGQGSHTAQAGEYRVWLEVDSGGEILESREDNNQLELSFTVAPAGGGGTDLRLLPLRVDPSHPVAGGPAQVEIRAENAGNTSVADVEVELVVLDPQGGASSQRWSFGTLGPGESSAVTQEIVGREEGLYQLRAAVDPDQLVPETSETNNRVDLDLPFAPGGECLPCTSGSPNHVGARLCFDAPGSASPSEGSFWQCRGVRANGTSCVTTGNQPNGWEPGGDRCPDPADLCAGRLHPDACGELVCPGTAFCWI